MLFTAMSAVIAGEKECKLQCGLHDKQEYWGEDGSRFTGRTAASFVKESGTIISITASLAPASTSNGKITININGTFKNYQALTKSSLYWYVLQYNVFDVKYNIQQQNSSGTWQTIKTISKTYNYLPFNTANYDPSNWPGNYANRYYVKNESFSEVLDNIDLQYTPNMLNYNIRVHVTIEPNKGANFNKNISSSSHYLEENYYWENCNPFEESFTGGIYEKMNKTYTPAEKLSMKAFKVHEKTTTVMTVQYKSTGHQIITDTKTTPYKTLKGNTYYLVYGDENAVLKVSLPKENVTASLNNKPAQSAMVVGVNRDPFTSSISFCGNSSGSGCSEYDYIEYTTKSNSFLLSELTKYSGGTNNKVRFKGLMLQTETNALTGKTSIKTPSIVTLNSSESSSIWYTKTFLLSDMQYAVTRNSQASSITNSGTLLNVAHKLCYFDYTAKDGFMELGYASSLAATTGRSLIQRLASYNDAQNVQSTNTLKFYVVPKAVFNSMDADLLATQYVCMPTNSFSATKENELIILYDKTIKSEDGTIDANIYEPEYFWEFSYNKTTWNRVTESNFVDPTFDIDKGDKYVKTGILTNNSVVYFRQCAVLKAFSSDSKNDLYTEKIDGRYYIRVNAEQYYTYKKMPTPVAEQFAFTQGDDYISIDTKECYSNIEVFNGKKIKFDLVPNANMSEEEYNALRNIASYTLTRKKIIGNNENKEIIPYNSETGYTITNYDGSKWVFDASIEFCNGMKLQKSITINAYDDITVNLNEITTETKGASIISRDNVYNVLQVMCPKDEDFKIRYFLDTENRQNLAAYEAKAQYVCPNYPDMVPYPDHVAPNFEDMSRTELVQYISDKGWSFEDDNMGQSLDEATRTQIKTYLIYKDNFVYKADSIAYVDAYKADSVAYYADCELKNEWFPFQDSLNYTATLKNITDNENEAVFYMRVRSSDGCYSDDVTFYVTYFDGITGNTIAFTDDKYKGKDIISVTAGEGNPFIKGDLVEGAYGIPKDNTDCTYTYVWQFYNTDTDDWDVLTDTNGNAFEYVEKNDDRGNRPQSSQQFISLNANTIANISAAYPGGLQIRRVVYSQKGNDANAKLPSESNVLQIYAAKPIEEDKFSYYFDEEFCPGKGYAYIEFDDVEFAENEVLEATILTKGQEQLNVLFNYAKKLGGIENPTEDISLSLCRIDTLTKVRSNAVILDIDVPELKADFIVYVDGKEHKLTEDVINVQAGSRVVLYNESENGFDGGSIYNWTLQVQKDGYEAQSSEKEDPVCYLYNPGINTIKLEVVSSNRCRNSITANNINVILAEGRSYPIISHFEESREQLLSVAPYMNVSPTVLIDESVVTINSNIDRYDVIVTDIAGKVMLTAENLGLRSQLNLDFLPDGIYILHASGNTFKLIKK